MSPRNMIEQYKDQFAPMPDLLHIAISRSEIMAAMRHTGEDTTIDQVCMAVAVVVDALESARQAS